MMRLQPWEMVTASLALTCWVMTVVKVRDLVRRPADPALRYLCLVLVSITLALSLQPVAWRLDLWTGVLDLGRVAAPDQPARRARRPVFWALACVAVIAGLLVLVPPPYDLADPYVRSRAYYYATASPAAAPYGLVYLLCLGGACARLAMSTIGYARVAARPLVQARAGPHLAEHEIQDAVLEIGNIRRWGRKDHDRFEVFRAGAQAFLRIPSSVANGIERRLLDLESASGSCDRGVHRCASRPTCINGEV